MYNRFQSYSLMLILIYFLSIWNVLAQDKNEVGGVSQEVRTEFSEAMKVYFELEDAIFAENIKNAAEKGLSLKKVFVEINTGTLNNTQKFFLEKQLQLLSEAATDLNSRQNINGQRGDFLAISNALIEIVKKFGPLDYDTFLIHCPMAVESGGHWLSQSQDIANPYFGKSMAGCGTLVETFAKSAEQK